MPCCINFASRTLLPSEQNYAQVIVLNFWSFQVSFLPVWTKCMLVTDHKPLTSVLGPKKGVPPIAAARLQRWALKLSACSYDIQV